jgi:hypothetical protein
MRGTLALDEDDAAHLQELQRQKEAENDAQVRFTEAQLASFRAAQAERFERSTKLDEHQPLSTHNSGIITSDPIDKTKVLTVPNIKIKKRRRQERDNDVAEVSEMKRNSTDTMSVAHDERNPAHTSKTVESNNNKDDAILSLLVGYSSDEDND